MTNVFANRIRLDLRDEYGSGLDKLSAEQLSALQAQKVLQLLLGQASDEMQPAIRFATDILRNLRA